jgi:hypothetical protein
LTVALHTSDQPVGVGIPAREQDLKEQHGRRPHCRCAAKPRENEFTDHGLDLKKQKSRKKNTDGEDEHAELLCSIILHDNLQEK